MSAPQPPTIQSPTPTETNDFTSAKKTLATTLLIASPILLILPPRKLDLYTFSLSGAFILSANEIAKQRTGRGLFERVGSGTFAGQGRGGSLPTEKAYQVQERLKREKLIRAQPGGQGMERGVGVGIDSVEKPPPTSSPSSQSRQEQESNPPPNPNQPDQNQSNPSSSTLLHKIWMGDQPPDWKERRLASERKALAEGKGYSDLIMDQIWGVWNQERNGDGDGNRNENGEKKEGEE